MTALRTVIVGASHAGAQLAASLRQEGWDGEIVLVGDESPVPYHAHHCRRPIWLGRAPSKSWKFAVRSSTTSGRLAFSMRGSRRSTALLAT